MTDEVETACVIIGRNEGARLDLSLRSVQAANIPALYVDSGSSDGSPALAQRLDIPIIELDPVRPFSAARARNEGFQRALRLWPDASFILFLDGDCTLASQFPTFAALTFHKSPSCAIVTGHLAERFPEASVYNRLCALEWRSPAGIIENVNALGGIMMVRKTAFMTVGGFNEEAIAGEEPDLGVRLLLAGYSIIKIDEPMAVHDAHILTFGQWWTRAVRAGHALGHRYARHGHTKFRDGQREIASTAFWGLALPVMVILLLPSTRGLSLLLSGTYLVLGWRIYRHYIKAGWNRSDARLAARHIVYGKFAQVVGLFRYLRNRLVRRFEIIEYK
jgi:GT2 family glycosyltransferase